MTEVASSATCIKLFSDYIIVKRYLWQLKRIMVKLIK